jgi:hypothetical protein
MSFHLDNAKTIPLTRELAQTHMNLEPSPTERELDPSRVKHLARKAEDGQLVAFNWAVAKIGEKIVRMNGQHSSTMLCSLNGSFPSDLSVHLDTYNAETEADLAVLFRQFDDRKSSRSSKDVAAAYQGLHTDLDDVTRPIAKLAVEGIAWFLRRVEGTMNLGGDDVYTLFDKPQYHPFVKWMGELHTVKTPEMRVIAVAAAMYSTFEVNPDQARTFWQQVSRGGVEFEDDAPATILDNWLKLAKNIEEKRRLYLMDGNYWQACIYAWRAFIEGKPITKLAYKVDHKGLLPAYG